MTYTLIIIYVMNFNDLYTYTLFADDLVLHIILLSHCGILKCTSIRASHNNA